MLLALTAFQSGRSYVRPFAREKPDKITNKLTPKKKEKEKKVVVSKEHNVFIIFIDGGKK